MRKISLIALLLVSLVVYCSRLGCAQSPAVATSPAEISADLGTCSALITLTGIGMKPIYAAKVTTRM